MAHYASVKTYSHFFVFHGFEKEAEEIRQRFRAGDIPGMIAACSNEMVDALSIAGTEDEVLAKLRDYEGLVDAVKLSPPTQFLAEDHTRAAQQATLRLPASLTA